MFIVDWERNTVLNVDNFSGIFLADRKIFAKYANVAGHKLQDLSIGEYATKERAAEVFKDMLEKCFPVNCLVTSSLPDDVNEFWDKMSKEGFKDLVVKNDCHVERFDIGTYYMPEE